MSAQYAGTAILTHDPKIEVNDDGIEFCQIRVRTTESRYDRGSEEWVKEQPMFFSIRVYRQQARNLVASVIKDDQIMVIGRLRQDGSELQILPDDIGVGLRFHAAVVTKDDSNAE